MLILGSTQPECYTLSVKNKQSEQNLILPETMIAEIAELYPEVVTFLVQEYGFHCVGCFASQFESLEQGAWVHGIIDSDFDEMLKKINEIAANENG